LAFPPGLQEGVAGYYVILASLPRLEATYQSCIIPFAAASPQISNGRRAGC
jgi:hypothetical protein